MFLARNGAFLPSAPSYPSPLPQRALWETPLVPDDDLMGIFVFHNQALPMMLQGCMHLMTLHVKLTQPIFQGQPSTSLHLC